jgi:hypothetical protein
MKNKHLYPPHWKEISTRCKQIAGWKCQHCGVNQGDERISRRGRPYKVALQACHKDHSDRMNPHAELLCLCVRCHWWYDFGMWLREQEVRIERLKHRKLLEVKRQFALTRA